MADKICFKCNSKTELIKDTYRDYPLCVNGGYLCVNCVNNKIGNHVNYCTIAKLNSFDTFYYFNNNSDAYCPNINDCGHRLERIKEVDNHDEEIFILSLMSYIRQKHIQKREQLMKQMQRMDRTIDQMDDILNDYI